MAKVSVIITLGCRIKVLSIMFFLQVDDSSMINLVPRNIRDEEKLTFDLVLLTFDLII